MKMLVVLSMLCLPAAAQTEYSGIAGASPRLVRAHKKALPKEARNSSRTETVSGTAGRQPAGSQRVTASTAPRQTARKDSGEMEVRQGLQSVSRGVGQVVKREVKTMGEITRKIGEGGKKFFKKLGKGISDSFKSDSTSHK